jgi:glycine dehydrogenase subunit 2
MRLIFEQSRPGRRGTVAPETEVPAAEPLPEGVRRTGAPELPEVSELDVVRHFTNLSQLNFSVDTHFYPLGSCTMKYNPKVNEQVARLFGFTELHPLLPQFREGEQLTQGALGVIYELDVLLREITGMGRFTMQPLAGAHGELTGVMIMAAYHRDRKNKKTKIIVPDSAHGTNPASAAIAGFSVVTVPSDERGNLDVDKLREAVDEETAGLMLTCPNTLGLFEERIEEICKIVHDVDGLVYYDGANLNAILGKARPGDLGFDIVHVNVHKTFGTPHGSGGPGSGPVGVVEKLDEYLPISLVEKTEDGRYWLEYNRPKSIGYIAPFYGNFGVLIRGYAYILSLGRQGLIEVAENAVLNANYLLEKLRGAFDLPYDRTCMHEFVLSASNLDEYGLKALDVAKALLSRGYHAPTVYFPTIVPESMMIEPTETESKETLDDFAEALLAIAKEARENPDAFHNYPTTTPVSRPDEVKAAREMDLG